MSKTVLLARPHPFIVSEMQPFLEQNGKSDLVSVERRASSARIVQRHFR